MDGQPELIDDIGNLAGTLFQIAVRKIGPSVLFQIRVHRREAGQKTGTPQHRSCRSSGLALISARRLLRICDQQLLEPRRVGIFIEDMEGQIVAGFSPVAHGHILAADLFLVDFRQNLRDEIRWALPWPCC